MDDTHYFTVGDLERAFALVIDRERALLFARAWGEHFAEYIVEGRVVALPESFGVARLAPPAPISVSGLDERNVGLENSMHGPRLLRFTDGTLTLVAGANPDVRRRFDRLGVRYAWAAIDDPARWREMLDFLRRP